MTKVLFGAVIAAGLTLVGCREREAETQQPQQQMQQPQTGTGGAGENVPEAEQVEPHTMGGTESHPQGKEVVPPEDEAIGGAQEGEPVLQDDLGAQDRSNEMQEQMQAPAGDDQQRMQQNQQD